jgi:hypothetical protein
MLIITTAAADTPPINPAYVLLIAAANVSV